MKLMTGGGSKPRMKNSKVSFLLLAALATKYLLWTASAATQLQGAGATFPAPLYQRWIAEYTKANSGSADQLSRGRQRRRDQTIHPEPGPFGASDAAMKDEEIAAVKQGVVLIPATAGSIVLAYNLPGVDNSQTFPRSLRRHFPRQNHEVE